MPHTTLDSTRQKFTFVTVGLLYVFTINNTQVWSWVACIPYQYCTTQPPLLESHYELEETFWEPASTYEEVYQQIAAKSKEKLGGISNGVTLLEKLGEGEFGMVYKGEWTSSPQGQVQVAVKALHSQEEESRYKLLKEAAIMGQFSHPNVVKLLGVVVSDEQVSGISTEYSYSRCN